MATAIVAGWPIGMRSLTGWRSRPLTAPCHWTTSPVRSPKRAPPRCPTRDRPRSNASSPRSGRGHSALLRPQLRNDAPGSRLDSAELLGAARRLHDRNLVVLGDGPVGRVPLQMVAPHPDFVAHEFIAELEGLQPVAADRAVAQ